RSGGGATSCRASARRGPPRPGHAGDGRAPGAAPHPGAVPRLAGRGALRVRALDDGRGGPGSGGPPLRAAGDRPERAGPRAADGAAAAAGHDAALRAIVAHGLLNSGSVVGTAAATLDEAWAELSDTMRRRLLRMILEHNAHITTVLDGLARGLPLEALLAVP